MFLYKIYSGYKLYHSNTNAENYILCPSPFHDKNKPTASLINILEGWNFLTILHSASQSLAPDRLHCGVKWCHCLEPGSGYQSALYHLHVLLDVFSSYNFDFSLTTRPSKELTIRRPASVPAISVLLLLCLFMIRGRQLSHHFGFV